MILDRLDQASRYLGVHPAFSRAFECLRTTDLASLAPGRHEIDGDRIYLSIDHVSGRGQAAAKLECHRRHIDVQLTIEGEERIGWAPLAACTRPDGPFDPARDVGFFSDPPATWLVVPPGQFAVFFPADAHAPLAGTGTVRKAIVKIRIS